MPEQEPITRVEKFLNGEVGMTPITREEKILAGEDVETITRREYFLKKYRGGGGGDITVVPLSVTENGTYSEEGKAYSPVSVNVPLPQNAYLLKSVSNLPQAIASFNDGEDMVMPSLKVAIEPIQEGSGDPSPTNVRPINGHTEANVVVSPTTDAEDGTTYNIQFKDGSTPLTVYDGTLDVVSGVLTVDRVMVDLGSLTWIYESSGVRFYTSDLSAVIFKPGDYNLAKVMCSIYRYITYRDFVINTDDAVCCIGSPSGRLYIKDSRFTDASAFKTAMNGVQLVYELTTPITIQLTPTQVKSLLGSNNVWADTGDITDAEYFSKEV